MALRSPYLYRIYLTEIMKEYKCDTFLSTLDYTQLEHVQSVSVLDTHISSRSNKFFSDFIINNDIINQGLVLKCM